MKKWGILALIVIIFISYKLGPKDKTKIPTEKPLAAVILLHGYGANAEDFFPIKAEIERKLDSKFKEQVAFFAPDGPVRMGSGRSWIRDSMTMTEIKDIEDYLTKYINQVHQEHEIPFDKIFVLGFSQGGAMAMHMHQIVKYELGGIFSLGSGLNKMDYEKEFKKTVVPIFLLGGADDPFFETHLGAASKNKLEQDGIDVYYELFPKLAHSVSVKEIKIVSNFINQKLSEN